MARRGNNPPLSQMYGTWKLKGHGCDSDDDSVCLPCRKMLKRFPRVSAEEREARKQRLRQELGVPGPIDIWLAEKLNDDAALNAANLAPNEVRCTVYIQRIPFPDPHEYFMDDDTYILHLNVTSAWNVYDVELAKYDQSIHSLKAPDWVKLPSGRTMVFRDSAAAVTELLHRLSLGGSELAT
ncbi:hypothetical protein FKP32DRAFT_1597638 [Trametes sanguinea]|nr:hypothetical protein FKP32DRAFT_1597638 [Trametes sanguinea]